MSGFLNALLTDVLLALISSCSCDVVKPTFRYVTLDDKEGKLMGKNDIEKTSINVLNPIIFIIGGVDKADKIDDSWSRNLTEAYLEKQIQNVFVVDWDVDIKSGSNEAQKNAENAGLSVADFIATLFNKTQESQLDIHLVGVFLGSQVASSAGKRLLELTGRKVNRITALDPTYYLINDIEAALSAGIHSENVNFLDAVHSNLTKFQDKLVQTGHVDFFVDEKNCELDELIKLKCDKFNAVKLFANSVNSDKLKAVQCDSVENYRKNKCIGEDRVTFGENMSKEVKGQYFIVYPV